MNTIGDRLRFLRASLKLSRDKLAEKLDIARSSLQKYEENQAVPGGNVLKSLSEHGFSSDWILTGRGNMVTDKSRVLRLVEGTKHSKTLEFLQS